MNVVSGHHFDIFLEGPRVNELIHGLSKGKMTMAATYTTLILDHQVVLDTSSILRAEW